MKTNAGARNRTKAVRLERAGVNPDGSVRRPMRLRLSGSSSGDSREVEGLEVTIEMSRGEAYAFSEWLDAAVTQTFAKPPAKRGSKEQENRS